MLLEVWRDMGGGKRRPSQYEAQRQVLHDPDELGHRTGLLHGLVTVQRRCWRDSSRAWEAVPAGSPSRQQVEA